MRKKSHLIGLLPCTVGLTPGELVEHKKNCSSAKHGCLSQISHRLQIRNLTRLVISARPCFFCKLRKEFLPLCVARKPAVLKEIFDAVPHI